jgi:hypothetical protein
MPIQRNAIFIRLRQKHGLTALFLWKMGPFSNKDGIGKIAVGPAYADLIGELMHQLDPKGVLVHQDGDKVSNS